MLQAAASWLITTLPLLNFPHDRSEISRSGNQHRKFIPTDVFRTLDGYLYMAVGNDLQWGPARRCAEIHLLLHSGTLHKRWTSPGTGGNVRGSAEGVQPAHDCGTGA